MLIAENDINYSQLESELENRLKIYVNLEKRKFAQGNFFSGNFMLYPKCSSISTSFTQIATTYFEIYNHIEYHYYEEKILLQGFYVYEDVRRPVHKFILQTTIEEFKLEFLSLRNNLSDKDTVYLNYIIRVPINEKDSQLAYQKTISSQVVYFKNHGKYYEVMQQKIITNSRLYKLKNAELILEQKKSYYKKKIKTIKAQTKQYKRDNKEANNLNQNNYRIFIKTVKKLFKQEEKKIIWQNIGCTPRQLRLNIEKKFAPGMKWSNWGEWDLEYIIPISPLHKPDEVIALNHHSNLKPTWKKE